ncbi:hypothetical protein ZWY2020_020259 [Hordeum vulgare]|nr:hypothetical protein ZWY2020_060087 [Hordeum vulgare]KAI4987459.1 hypothetical protein ZWY2020_020259 [Hordeum vulgare]
MAPVMSDCSFGGPGIMTDELRNFLELNQPKMKEGKKDKFRVSVMEPKVGSHIAEATGILSESNDYIQELLCAMRQHFDQFIDELKFVAKHICVISD